MLQDDSCFKTERSLAAQINHFLETDIISFEIVPSRNDMVERRTCI